jgi:hypothetical protein
MGHQTSAVVGTDYNGHLDYFMLNTNTGATDESRLDCRRTCP